MSGDNVTPITADAYCVRIMGDSLRPRIKSGDFVVISPNHPYEVTDEVMVMTIDGMSMIKEFLFERDGMVALQDINGLGERLTISRSEIVRINYIAAITKDALYHVKAPAVSS